MSVSDIHNVYKLGKQMIDDQGGIHFGVQRDSALESKCNLIHVFMRQINSIPPHPRRRVSVSPSTTLNELQYFLKNNALV